MAVKKLDFGLECIENVSPGRHSIWLCSRSHISKYEYDLEFQVIEKIKGLRGITGPLFHKFNVHVGEFQEEAARSEAGEIFNQTVIFSIPGFNKTTSKLVETLFEDRVVALIPDFNKKWILVGEVHGLRSDKGSGSIGEKDGFTGYKITLEGAEEYSAREVTQAAVDQYVMPTLPVYYAPTQIVTQFLGAGPVAHYQQVQTKWP